MTAGVGKPSLQFSLRSLFIGVTLAMICLATCAKPAILRCRTIRQLEAMGAAISYDYQWGRDGAWRIGARAPGRSWLKSMLGENYRAGVVEVQLFTDQDMAPEKFTDEHARGIATLTELKWLVLMDTRLTDDGLAILKALPKLERLDLEGTKVTDQGVADFLRSRPNVRLFH